MLRTRASCCVHSEDELHFNRRGRSRIVGARHFNVRFMHQWAMVTRARKLNNHILAFGNLSNDVIVDDNFAAILDAECSDNSGWVDLAFLGDPIQEVSSGSLAEVDCAIISVVIITSSFKSDVETCNYKILEQAYSIAWAGNRLTSSWWTVGRWCITSINSDRFKRGSRSINR